MSCESGPGGGELCIVHHTGYCHHSHPSVAILRSHPVIHIFFLRIPSPASLHSHPRILADTSGRNTFCVLRATVAAVMRAARGPSSAVTRPLWITAIYPKSLPKRASRLSCIQTALRQLHLQARRTFGFPILRCCLICHVVQDEISVVRANSTWPSEEPLTTWVDSTSSVTSSGETIFIVESN